MIVALRYREAFLRSMIWGPIKLPIQYPITSQLSEESSARNRGHAIKDFNRGLFANEMSVGNNVHDPQETQDPC